MGIQNCIESFIVGTGKRKRFSAFAALSLPQPWKATIHVTAKIAAKIKDKMLLIGFIYTSSEG